MATYRLHLEYDGSDFHGWQTQPGRRTVQAELQAALGQVLGEEVKVVGAGRTDAGVHALGQVASFVVCGDPEPRKLLRGSNALLPEDAHIWALGKAADGFSARGDALWRRYLYRFLRQPSPVRRQYGHVLRWRVDVDAMARAAESLCGTHDFTAFVATSSTAIGRECTVSRAEVVAGVQELRFEIVANRFLYNMVRRLSGALLEVGRGRLTAADLGRILEERDTSRGGPCLPARGLYLMEVGYPADPQFESTAVVDGMPWTP